MSDVIIYETAGDVPSVESSADTQNTGGVVTHDFLPVKVSHVVSPDEIYVQHATADAQKNLTRFDVSQPTPCFA